VKNLETIRVRNGTKAEWKFLSGSITQRRMPKITQMDPKLTGRLVGKLKAAEGHRGSMFMFTELTES
jgi:hypothetical protein